MKGGPAHDLVEDRRYNASVSDVAPAAKVVRYPHIRNYRVMAGEKFHLKPGRVYRAATKAVVICAVRQALIILS
jgi:hypothetical protein